MALGSSLLGGLAGGAVVSIVINAVDKFSGTFSKAGLGMKALGTAAIAGGAAIATGLAVVGTQSVKTFAEVEKGFAQVNTLLDDGQNAYEIYGDSIRKVSNEMGIQGGELGALSGLYQTISAGITDTADASFFLEKASVAAVGGSAELSTVIEAGTKAMASYGIEVKDSGMVFDKFAAIVKAGQTTMTGLATAFPRISGMGAELNITMDELGGTFAGLTKIMRSPEEAATGLSAVMTGLLKPSEDLKTLVKDLGYESATTMLDQEGLMGTLLKLKDATGGNAEAMGGLFGNVRALRAIMPALGAAADDVATSIDIVTNSAGLSEKQFADMDKTASQSFAKLKNTAISAFADIGRVITPIIMPIVEAIGEFFKNIDTDKLNTFIKQMTDGVAPIFNKFLEYLNAIKPVAMFIWNNMISMIKTILPYAQELFIKILDFGKKIFTDIADAINRNKPTIEALFKNMASMGKIAFEVLSDIFDIFGSIWNIIVDLGLLDLIIMGFGNAVAIIKVLYSWLKPVLDIISDVFSFVSDLIRIISKSDFGQFIGDLFKAGNKMQNDFLDMISVDDFIISGGKLIQTNPKDTIVGYKGDSPFEGGSGVNVQIQNVYGVDPYNIAEAIEEQLANKITL